VSAQHHTATKNTAGALQPAPYTEHYVEIAGLNLRMQDYGTAGKPTMLCLHGGAANAHWYDFVAEGFTADYHMRAIDLRGHGDSQWDTSPTPDYDYKRHAADVDELAAKLDLRDFILIGHSMGGMISSIYAATYPGRAKAFILVDTTITMTPARIAGFSAISNREGRHYASQDEFIANYRVHPGGSTAAPEVLRHIAQHSGRRFEDGRWRHKVDRKVYAERELVDSFSLWNKIKIPTLLMKGERSVRIDPATITNVKSRAPQVQVAEVAHSDHHITLDNPSGFVQAAREFLNTLE
jgi:pimeloyl-ACP methyl ester carboxylesterase